MVKVIVVLGCVGSGKSSHSMRFSKEAFDKGMPIHHVSVGMHLWAIRSGLEDSEFASLINDPRAPSPLPTEILHNVLFENVNQLQSGVALIDGYPRHAAWVEEFLKALAHGGHDFLGGLYLNVDYGISMQRILARGQRKGERVRGANFRDFIHKRYEADAQEINQVVAGFEKAAPIFEVDANNSIDEAWRQFQIAMFMVLGDSFS